MSTHHLRLALAGLVALAVTLAGCGEESVEGIGEPTDPVGGEYVGEGPVQVFPDGSAPIRLTLRDGQISFTATCNHFSGQATWDDGVLRTSALGGTEMGCPAAGHEQDEWMVEFFGSSPELEPDGTDLAVRSESAEVWFVPADEVASGRAGDADDLAGEVERSVLRVLTGKNSATRSISGDDLRLVTRDGRHELVYHR